MRVIAGSAKGARLAPVPAGTRPLSEMAREGLFSSLGDRVIDARCADLFAGTGALGIEALSRGAASCLFVDAARGAIRAIQANLTRTGLLDRARVVHRDALSALGRESDAFDLAFLDPPYDLEPGLLRSVLEAVGDRMEPEGTFVLTRPRREDATDVIPLDWRAAKLLRYGDARILVCRREP